MRISDWSSDVCSSDLAGLAWKLGDVGFANALRDLPGSLLFWIAFAGYYFALPASEFLIFKRLWNIPRAGFKALIRKLICNEILFGYSGEAYFYTWARRQDRKSTRLNSSH